MNQLRLCLSTVFWLGLAPVAPGTFGTLGGVAIAWGLSRTDHYLAWLGVVCVALYLIGRPLGDWAEQHNGGKDPGFFVLDEVLGYLVTVAWIGSPTWLTLVVGFFVFRFFDIVKPWPVRAMEKIGGGDGILLDDVVAAFYGLAVMAVARLLFGEPAMWTVGI